MAQEELGVEPVVAREVLAGEGPLERPDGAAVERHPVGPVLW